MKLLECRLVGWHDRPIRRRENSTIVRQKQAAFELRLILHDAWHLNGPEWVRYADCDRTRESAQLFLFLSARFDSDKPSQYRSLADEEGL